MSVCIKGEEEEDTEEEEEEEEPRRQEKIESNGELARIKGNGCKRERGREGNGQESERADSVRGLSHETVFLPLPGPARGRCSPRGR